MYPQATRRSKFITWLVGGSAKEISMFKAGEAVRVFAVSVCAAFLLSPNVLAQSETVQRIALEEAQAKAQAQSGAGKLANLARLGIDAARYHRKAAQADYLPKIGSE